MQSACHLTFIELVFPFPSFHSLTRGFPHPFAIKNAQSLLPSALGFSDPQAKKFGSCPARPAKTPRFAVSRYGKQFSAFGLGSFGHPRHRKGGHRREGLAELLGHAMVLEDQLRAED